MADLGPCLVMVDEILDSMRDFPIPNLFEGACRMKAMILKEMNKENEAVGYLLESAGVSARAKYEDPSTDIASSKKEAEEFTRPLNEDLIKFKRDFNVLEYEKQLWDLPSDWTIVQISELPGGITSLAPPRFETKNTRSKPLAICRIGCGNRYNERILRYVPSSNFLPFSKNNDVLQELNETAKDFIQIPHVGTHREFNAKKLAVEEKFKAVLESLHYWIAEHRCLFLGKLPSDEIEDGVNNIILKLANSLEISKEDFLSFKLLVEGCKFLTETELLRGIEQILHKSSIEELRIISKQIRSCGIKLETKYNLSSLIRKHVILIIDKVIYKVPWESLDVLHSQPVSRMPCLSLINALYIASKQHINVNSKSVYFVIDPDNNLKNTAKRMQPALKARPAWSGTVSKAPSKEELVKALQEQDIYLYCGHGAGTHLLPTPFKKLQCNSVAILIGCSSSDLNKLGNFWEFHGAPVNFMLSGSPATLGMLNDVFDKEADKLTIYLFETWIPPNNLEEYKRKMKENDKYYEPIYTKPTENLHLALAQVKYKANYTFIASSFIANGLPISLCNTNN